MEFDHRIHKRLLSRDPIAPAELAGAYLELLARRLRSLFPNLKDKNLLWDAAVDAVLGYAEHPERFKPGRSSLWGYLVMAARGDLLNALARERRQARREAPLELVEDPAVARNLIEKEDGRAEVLEASEKLQSLYPRIRKIVSDPKDLKIVDLMIQGERKTEAYAAALGVVHLPEDKKRRVVKQHKDRLKKRLQRLGVKLRDEGAAIESS